VDIGITPEIFQRDKAMLFTAYEKYEQQSVGNAGHKAEAESRLDKTASPSTHVEKSTKHGGSSNLPDKKYTSVKEEPPQNIAVLGSQPVKKKFQETSDRNDAIARLVTDAMMKKMTLKDFEEDIITIMMEATKGSVGITEIKDVISKLSEAGPWLLRGLKFVLPGATDVGTGQLLTTVLCQVAILVDQGKEKNAQTCFQQIILKAAEMQGRLSRGSNTASKDAETRLTAFEQELLHIMMATSNDMQQKNNMKTVLVKLYPVRDWLLEALAELLPVIQRAKAEELMTAILCQMSVLVERKENSEAKECFRELVDLVAARVRQ